MMNDALKMQISAFVDGELPANEADLLMRRLSQDVALKRKAEEYFAIGRLLRGEKQVPGVSQLRERISQALANESFEAPEVVGGNGYLRPAAGFAIAASVALLALVGLRQVNLPEDSEVMTADNAGIAIDDSAGYTEPAASDVMSDRPSEMLMQYYLSHGETSSDLGANGILSRLVTLELRGGELVEVSPGDEALAADPEDADNDAAAPADRE
jgi:negative regulator of sigma E activity